MEVSTKLRVLKRDIGEIEQLSDIVYQSFLILAEDIVEDIRKKVEKVELTKIYL